MSKFKIGDKVICIDHYNDNGNRISELEKGKIYTITGDSSDDGCYVKNAGGGYCDWHFKLKTKAKDIAITNKFMVYGTGCDNKSNLFNTKPEAEDYAKEMSKDSSWSGRTIVYELVPRSEAVVETLLKVFKVAKVKKARK